MTGPIPPPFGTPPERGLSEPTDRSGAIPTLWARIGARLIDQILLLVITALVLLLDLTISADTDVAVDLPRWVLVVAVVIPIVYEVAFLAWRGATPGKMAVGIAVRNAGDGGRIAVHQAAMRVLVAALGAVLALATPSAELASLLQLATPIVYSSVLWDPRRRGLHDRAAGTIVLRTR